KKQKTLKKFPHQFFYFTGLRIRNILNKISGMLVPAPVAVYEKAQGFWVSRAIVTACELNLAEHLASGTKHISELARLSGTHEESLYRLMRTLAGEGIFKELPGRNFINTSLSSALKDGDDSMKYMILHHFGENQLILFSHLTECIRSGEDNFRKYMGNEAFKYLEENPDKNEIYNKAMDNSSGLVALALLSSYSFHGIKTLVDLGGGHGLLLSAILEKYPNMKGILFDQPHVVGETLSADIHPDIKSKIEIIRGDFFEDIPSGADAYFMKNILHAFGEEDCLHLLKKIHAVMADKGKIIILETIIEPDNKPALGKRLDLVMMTGTGGGKERTREEFYQLLDRSGFALNRIIRTVAPFCVIEAGKK
ncbi:MAG: hypothetical protein HGA23_08765, partial [Bacteroidales bacterium]|nr:hypothetical protein [Bacteroidales bacterium]